MHKALIICVAMSTALALNINLSIGLKLADGKIQIDLQGPLYPELSQSPLYVQTSQSPPEISDFAAVDLFICKSGNEKSLSESTSCGKSAAFSLSAFDWQDAYFKVQNIDKQAITSPEGYPLNFEASSPILQYLAHVKLNNDNGLSVYIFVEPIVTSKGEVCIMTEMSTTKQNNINVIKANCYLHHNENKNINLFTWGDSTGYFTDASAVPIYEGLDEKLMDFSLAVNLKAAFTDKSSSVKLSYFKENFQKIPSLEDSSTHIGSMFSSYNPLWMRSCFSTFGIDNKAAADADFYGISFKWDYDSSLLKLSIQGFSKSYHKYFSYKVTPDFERAGYIVDIVHNEEDRKSSKSLTFPSDSNVDLKLRTNIFRDDCLKVGLGNMNFSQSSVGFNASVLGQLRSENNSGSWETRYYCKDKEGRLSLEYDNTILASPDKKKEFLFNDVGVLPKSEINDLVTIAPVTSLNVYYTKARLVV